MFGEEQHVRIIIETEKQEKMMARKIEIAKRSREDTNKIVNHYSARLAEIQKDFCSPFTVSCASTTGQLLKISVVDFQKKMAKDKELIALLRTNLLHKESLTNNVEARKRVDLKFASGIKIKRADLKLVDSSTDFERAKTIKEAESVLDL